MPISQEFLPKTNYDPITFVHLLLKLLIFQVKIRPVKIVLEI